jgi:hypothetical protein
MRGQVSFGQMQVGSAHPARFDAHENLVATRAWNVTTSESQRSRLHRPGPIDPPRPHLGRPDG